MGLIDIRIPKELKKLPKFDAPIQFTNLDPGAQQVAVMTFYILSSLCRKKALKLIRKTKEENGYEAWRIAHRKFDPASDRRYLNMLGEITGPQMGDKLEGFDEVIEDWEAMILVYEEMTNEVISDSLMRSVLLNHAPGELKNHLQPQSHTLLTYDAMKMAIESDMEAKRVWKRKTRLGGGKEKDDDKMDISLSEKGGKGKWKGGKGKGYGKDKKGKKG